MKNLSIIGGGAAALMLAAQLDRRKYKVTIFEKKKTVGRKFLVAGEGGLNLTYHASVEALTMSYVPNEFMRPVLHQFTNEDLRQWLAHLGVPTFVGSSHRVFPEAGLKPIEVLNKITDHLIAKDVQFQFNAKWIAWDAAGHPCFENLGVVESDVVVFAMGGASWKVTGSDGKWRTAFENRGVQVLPFRAANCAFEVNWQSNFIATHEGKPLKNIGVAFKGHYAKGELVVSKFGLEGNAIYALSQQLQEALLRKEKVVLYLDLKPSMSLDQIKAKYQRSRLTKVTAILKKELHLDRTSIGLLKQFSDKNTFLDPDLLAATLKAVPIVLHSAEELDKAISSLGGVALEEIDAHFQLKKIPHNYAIGEMLDWYAPTGGYLLQGCFSMGFVLAKHLNDM